MKDASPDHNDRVQDFLQRHGGAADRPSREGESAPGVAGWSEIYARDGHTLRCDWSLFGTHHEMRYTEIAPHS